MLNERVVEEHLTDFFANKFFHSIVYESFMNALPIDTSTVTQYEKQHLHQYVGRVLESIGGIKALESSIDIQNKTPEQIMFLAGLYNVCMESASKCAKENTEKLCKDGNCKAMDDVVQKATLSKEECAKFAKNANNMNLDEVAEIIKKKTLDVISDEKDQYKKEQELDSELENALGENDDVSDDLGDDLLDDDLNDDEPIADESSAASREIAKIDPDPTGAKSHGMDPKQKATQSANGPSKPVKAIEAFKAFHLEATDPRHHVSIFSRLQDTAMEMMSFIETPNYGRDYFPILEATTFESLFTKPVHIQNVVTEATTVAREEVCEIPKETQPKIATLISIITYTIMETLHTIGIFNPSLDNIRKFVNVSSNSLSLKQKAIDESCDSIKCAVKESAMLDFSKLSSAKLGDHLVTLKTALENAQSYIDKYGASTDIINLSSEAVNYIHGIENIMNQRAKDHQAMSEATESFQTKREKENDLAQFNRITNMFKGNPQIEEIRLLVNMDYPSVVDVECANESGNVIRTSFMNIEYACESDQYLKYLDDTYKKSKMPSMNKSVFVKLQDGKGTTIKL